MGPLLRGAGLGRLVMECARRGFDTEGNEYSYYMLLTSSYILNHATRPGQFLIHPWMHNNNNHLSDTDQLRATPVPDLPACEAGRGGATCIHRSIALTSIALTSFALCFYRRSGRSKACPRRCKPSKYQLEHFARTIIW